MTTRTICAMVTVLGLTGAPAARAQTPASSTTQGSTMPLGDKVFVSVNVGAQTGSANLTRDWSFPVYRETATSTTSSSVGRGAIFDVMGGYRIKPQLGVAVGFSTFGSTGAAQGTASVPNPLFFNRPAAVVISPVDAKRTERSTYIVLVGSLPVAEKMDLSAFVGPSFIRVTQDIIYDVSVAPGTQSVVSPIRNETGTAKGVNVGADLSYQVFPQVGAAVFLRYNGGSLDLPSVQGVKAGGFQIGIGARFRF